MLRLLVWICCAAAAVAPPHVHHAAAGESRAVVAVTARVVHACSVSAPDLVPEGSAGTDATVDHRCTSSTATVPHTVSVRATDDATGAGGAPTLTAQGAGNAAGETLILTVTY